MARIVLTAVLVVLLNVLVGCGSADSGRSQLRPRLGTSLDTAPAVEVGRAVAEVDIVEQMAVNRQAYRQGLLMLIDHYAKAGDNMKLPWAKKELAALDAMPKYNYIIEAIVAGPELKAAATIPEAELLYNEAVGIHNKAKKLVLVKNNNQMRLALDKYNQVIKKHPSSDKIDDAAFKAGEICEYFKDYSFALVYFKRAYQWDPETIHPARFRAAAILDRHLHRRGEALELYQQAIETEGKREKYRSWKEFAQRRISELTRTAEQNK